MVDRITIRKPDDWHLHVRDGDMMRAALPHTAPTFGRAIMMPNLVPPVATTADAVAYRERLITALPSGSTFKPLMTCYLTDDTDPDDVERGFKEGVFTGVKLYTPNDTTNSAAGATDRFARDAVFIERIVEPWTREFPELRFIHEHLSSKIGCDFVRSKSGQVGGTITPYHLELNRTDWLGWGNRPYMYCMPVIKTEADRQALRKAATGGEKSFFLGTDSAPHSIHKKLAVVGAAGLFNAPVAIETYAKVFDEENALDKLEAFASLNGPAHYRLPPNEGTITLKRICWTAPEEIKVEGPEERALIYQIGRAHV